jgi:hypothetical protein
MAKVSHIWLKLAKNYQKLSEWLKMVEIGRIKDKNGQNW